MTFLCLVGGCCAANSDIIAALGLQQGKVNTLPDADLCELGLSIELFFPTAEAVEADEANSSGSDSIIELLQCVFPHPHGLRALVGEVSTLGPQGLRALVGEVSTPGLGMTSSDQSSGSR